MISIPGSLSFAKLVMMSSAPAKNLPGMASPQDPLVRRLSHPIFNVCSFYVERKFRVFIILPQSRLDQMGTLVLFIRALLLIRTFSLGI